MMQLSKKYGRITLFCVARLVWANMAIGKPLAVFFWQTTPIIAAPTFITIGGRTSYQTARTGWIKTRHSTKLTVKKVQESWTAPLGQSTLKLIKYAVELMVGRFYTT